MVSCQELNVENVQIRTVLDRQKDQILAECQAEIKKHEFQAKYDPRSERKLGEIIESQKEELHCAQAEELQRRDQQLLHAQLLQQNSELRGANQRNLTEMEELRKFQSSTFDTIARRRIVEDQDTIFELTGKIQDLQNESNCVNDSKEFQDAESIRSGNSYLTSRPVCFPLHPVPGGMRSRSKRMPCRIEGPPSIWDTHGISGNVFANPDASSSKPFPQELNPWSSGREEPIHSSTAESSERRTQDQDPRCQSGPSARNSVILSEGDFQRFVGQTNNDGRFQIFMFSKFSTPATFACWKIRFKLEACTCSQFPTEAVHLVEGVEMVDSVDDWKIFVINDRNSNAEFLKYSMRGLLEH